MGKPYSQDLRKRVVAAIEGGMSRNRAAKQFGIAISTAINWMKRVENVASTRKCPLQTISAKSSRTDFALAA